LAVLCVHDANIADTRSTSTKLAAKMKADDSVAQPKTAPKPVPETQEVAITNIHC